MRPISFEEGRRVRSRTISFDFGRSVRSRPTSIEEGRRVRSRPISFEEGRRVGLRPISFEEDKRRAGVYGSRPISIEEGWRVRSRSISIKEGEVSPESHFLTYNMWAYFSYHVPDPLHHTATTTATITTFHHGQSIVQASYKKACQIYFH